MQHCSRVGVSARYFLPVLRVTRRGALMTSENSPSLSGCCTIRLRSNATLFSRCTNPVSFYEVEMRFQLAPPALASWSRWRCQFRSSKPALGRFRRNSTTNFNKVAGALICVLRMFIPDVPYCRARTPVAHFGISLPIFQIGISGWFTGRYSLRCQPVDYSSHPTAIRVSWNASILQRTKFVHSGSFFGRLTFMLYLLICLTVRKLWKRNIVLVGHDSFDRVF